ncbi:hypothetical protein D3C85_353620 [compost metagenome]
MKHEAATAPVIYAHAGHVGGQQVARELLALPLQSQRDGQRVGQSRLAYAGHIFDQQVAAGQHAGEGLADLQVFADENFADLLCGLVYFRKHAISITVRRII